MVADKMANELKDKVKHAKELLEEAKRKVEELIEK